MPRAPGRSSLIVAIVLLIAALFLLVSAPRASAGTAVLFIEDFEDGQISPQWQVYDANPASGLDYWSVSTYRAHAGNYSAWCAQIGTQSIGGQNNSDVHLYDDDMQADLVVNLSANGFTSLTLSFYYYSRTESGGGDWIQAWYEAGGSQFAIFNNTGGTGNKWDLATVSVPTNVERLIIRFHSDAANHGFEGAYVDDIVLTGTESVPPTSSLAPLPTYANTRTVAMPYTAQDNANASGVAYVELWYRNRTSGPYTLYTRPANPLGRWLPWLSPAIPFDIFYASNDSYYELYTIAVDNASNVEAAPANGTADARVTIDTTPPVLTLNAPAAGDLIAAPYVVVAWQSADALTGLDHYETSLDTAAFVTNGVAGSKNFTTLADGTHTVIVRAIDRAGNVAQVSVSFTIDATAPEVQIATPAPGQIINTEAVTFRWSATDTTAGIDHYEIWLDNDAPVITADEQLVLPSVADGTHTFHVRAVDRAGNTAEATVTFLTDKNPFSLTGPYRGLPLFLLLAIIIASLIFLLVWWKRRKDKEKEEAEIDSLGAAAPVAKAPVALESPKETEAVPPPGPTDLGDEVPPGPPESPP